MKINFTKRQYLALMDMCFISDLVINAYRQTPPVESEQHKDLLQYLLSFAKDFDFEDSVTYLKDPGTFAWSEEFMEQNEAARTFVDYYDSNRFADLLSDKLAEAALKEKYTEEELDKMDPKALWEQFAELKQTVLQRSKLIPEPAEAESGSK